MQDVCSYLVRSFGLLPFLKWRKVIQTRMPTKLDQKGRDIRTAQTREGN